MTKGFINSTFIRNVPGGKITKGIFDPWYNNNFNPTETNYLPHLVSLVWLSEVNFWGTFLFHSVQILEVLFYYEIVKAPFNRISSSCRQKIRNLFVAEFRKCWLPARCNTVWSFLFQIHLFKKKKKLSFVCWQLKSSRAIHNEVKSLLKLHLNLYVIYHHHRWNCSRWNWMLLLPVLLLGFWLEFLKISMPSAPLTKFQLEKMTNRKIFRGRKQHFLCTCQLLWSDAFRGVLR